MAKLILHVKQQNRAQDGSQVQIHKKGIKFCVSIFLINQIKLHFLSNIFFYKILYSKNSLITCSLIFYLKDYLVLKFC